MDGYDSGYSGADIQIAGEVISPGVLYDAVPTFVHGGYPAMDCYYTPFGNMNSTWTYSMTVFGSTCPPTYVMHSPDLG